MQIAKFPIFQHRPGMTLPVKTSSSGLLDSIPTHKTIASCILPETLDKNLILVKFTRHYSIELHAFCAERGRAPGILGFVNLLGDWSVVAMDFFFPPMQPSRSPNLVRL